MDEAVINGANLFFARQFGIDPSQGDQGRNQWLLGLVNSAPYVCVPTTSFDAFLLTLLRSCVAPSLVAGSQNLLIVVSVVGAPSSFAPAYLFSLAFGKVSPTRGNISSSLASSLE